MARRLPRGARLVLASHNPGKLREITELVAPHGVEVVLAGELGLPEPEPSPITSGPPKALEPLTFKNNVPAAIWQLTDAGRTWLADYT